MQSQITRHTARLARTCPRSLPARRTYAQDPYKDKGPTPTGPSAGRTNPIPTIALVSLAAAIPAFYFIQGTIGTGNKAPASGNKEIKQSRREGNASEERRDPRDSAKKTSSVDG